MTRLRQQTIALSDLDIDAFCDKLLAMARADHEDDIAVIALRLPPAHDGSAVPDRAATRWCRPRGRQPPAGR
jgi:hypothetical protein